MLTDLYVFADSPVHRARPVVKIAALVVLCTSLFVFEGWIAVTVAGVLVFAGFALAGLGPRHAIVSLRPALWILAAIFAVQLYMTDVVFAVPAAQSWHAPGLPPPQPVCCCPAAQW